MTPLEMIGVMEDVPVPLEIELDRRLMTVAQIRALALYVHDHAKS